MKREKHKTNWIYEIDVFHKPIKNDSNSDTDHQQSLK